MSKKNLAVTAALLSALVLCIGCGASLSRDDGDTSVQTQAAFAKQGDSTSAKGLDVEILQPNAPPLFPGKNEAHVEYKIKITNQGTEPATVKRITLWGAGGSYELEGNSSRTFKTVIAPGTTEEVSFWAKAVNVSSIGVSGPMTVRAEIHLQEPSGERRPMFTRTVNGNVGIGGTKNDSSPK
jgi:hypothetical protein